MRISRDSVIVLALILSLFAVLPLSSEPVSASLVIVGPGDPLYTYWGHIGLAIEDDDGRSRFYDFGNFSFHSDNFFADFALGRMVYIGMAMDTGLFLDFSLTEDRDLMVYPLNLERETLDDLDAFMRWKVLPDNREYLYDYFLDNCSHIIRDILNDASGGALREATESRPSRTYREFARIGAAPTVAEEILLHYLLGPGNDKPINVWEEMFLPETVAREAMALRYVGQDGIERTLADNPEVLRLSTRPPLPDEPRTLWPGMLLAGLTLGGLSLLARYGNRPWVRKLGGSVRILSIIIVGIPGLFVAFIMAFTNHNAGHDNLNVLSSIPTILAGLPLVIRGLKRETERWGRSEQALAILWSVNLLGVIVAAVLVLSGVVYQDIGAFVAFFGSLSLLSSWPVGVLIRRLRIGPPVKKEG